MIPQHLEKLIWDQQALSISRTFGGSGLSGLVIPEGQRLIVWSVQIFPFYDLDNATIAGSEDQWRNKVARGVHWIEFADKSQRYGLAQRSSHIEEGSTQGGLYAYPYPLPDAPPVPVYWIFEGPDLVCRITQIPSPGVVPYGADVPPAVEGQQVLPYTSGSSVLSTVSGFGPGGETWKPDPRRPFLANQLDDPRAIGDTGNGTALQLPNTLDEAQAVYSYPLVNVQAVIIKDKTEDL